MSVSDFTNKDVFDSRDIDERIEYFESLIPDPEDGETDTDDEPLDEDEREEYAALVAFREDVGSREWSYGITFIFDDYFEEYARELAADIGAIPNDCGWPCTCIDWEQAARELKMDYSCVRFAGAYFYFRD